MGSQIDHRSPASLLRDVEEGWEPTLWMDERSERPIMKKAYSYLGEIAQQVTAENFFDGKRCAGVEPGQRNHQHEIAAVERCHNLVALAQCWRQHLFREYMLACL